MRRVAARGCLAVALTVAGVSPPANAQKLPDAAARETAGAGARSDAQPGASGGSPPSAPRVSPERLRRALLRYRDEPTVAEVVAAARAADGGDLEAVRAAAARARKRGLVPQVKLGMRRRKGRGLSQLGVAVDGLHLSTDDDLVLDASVDFELDRLVFAGEEVSLLREERARRADRDERVRKVVGLYFERRRLQLERDLLGRGDVAHALRIAEIEALLDACTGGAYGRMLAASRKRER